MAVNYEQMLQQAQNSYGAITQGYQRALQGQQQRQQGINRGYNRLQQNVLGGIAQMGTARSQEIADQYARASGSAMQDLISSGLGNSTIQSSVGRGLQYDAAKAQNALTGDMAGLAAGYQSQLGLAGLNYRGQANRENTALQGQRLGYQGDYQRTLGGWAMQGLLQGGPSRAERNSGFSMQGGGGGGRNSILAPFSPRNPASDPGRYEDQDPYIDLSAGAYGVGAGYGGGAAPRQPVAPMGWGAEEVPYGGGYMPHDQSQVRPEYAWQ